jgi:hypothetical protein
MTARVAGLINPPPALILAAHASRLFLSVIFHQSLAHTHKHELLLLFFSLSTQGAFSPSLVAATYCAATYFSSRRRQEKARADIGRPLESSQCEILPAQATAEILQASVTTRSF